MKQVLGVLGWVFGPVVAVTAIVYIFRVYVWYAVTYLGLRGVEQGDDAFIFGVFSTLISCAAWSFGLLGVCGDVWGEPKKKNKLKK